ncbi:MAG: hypothetical protein D6722_19225 [Bacteroidetes bacterium]|nr:MAG: hypothetical protein D6722_19225 [Bacteroidota bacterium]
MHHQFLALLLVLAAFWPASALRGQVVLPWQAQYHPDSSYYEVARIDAHTWWVGGENGILYALSDSGTRQVLTPPGPPVNILKIRRSGDQVYLTGDQGTLFRYDLLSGQWQRRSLPAPYRRISFYDFAIVPESGTLVLVGGHQKIAKGHLAPPRGIMLRLPMSLEGAPERVWAHPGRFVWAIRRGLQPDEFIAVAFNGHHSRLWISRDGGQTFSPEARLPGLVHHLLVHEGHIWYSGTRDLRFRRTGMVGRVGEDPHYMDDIGCVWSLLPQAGGGSLLLTQAGTVLSWAGGEEAPQSLVSMPGPVYEGASMTGSAWVLVGHGRRLFRLDLGLQETAAR